jgi:hypothetical protein
MAKFKVQMKKNNLTGFGVHAQGKVWHLNFDIRLTFGF